MVRAELELSSRRLFVFSRCLTGTRTAMAAGHRNDDPDSVTARDRDSLASDSFQDSFQARVFKIIVVGDSNVGKTCLSYRFCEAKFLKNPEATIGVDFREKTLDMGGENIKVSACITARASQRAVWGSAGVLITSTLQTSRCYNLLIQRYYSALQSWRMMRE